MSITVLCSSTYMWYKNTEYFPFGMREVRPLLVARGLFGFFGVFGMYCEFPFPRVGTPAYSDWFKLPKLLSMYSTAIIISLSICPFLSASQALYEASGLTIDRLPPVPTPGRCHRHHLPGSQSGLLGLQFPDQRAFYPNGTNCCLRLSFRRYSNRSTCLAICFAFTLRRGGFSC